METAQVETKEQKTYRSTLELSIRRKVLSAGLPGDDPINQNPKIGSSLRGKSPLSGLDFEEEKKYLPEIIGISPVDTNWRKEVKEYWSNISERVPHDDESQHRHLLGRYLKFDVIFKNEKDKRAFETATTFELKSEITKRGDVDPADTADYVLFRYCLVYNRVANDVKDLHKSPNIDFYLYSREQQSKQEYNKFKLRTQALTIFTSLLDDDKKIDALIRLFGSNPDDANDYPTLEDKHIALEKFINNQPKTFIDYANDKELAAKAFILKAKEAGLIYNPSNTEMYYYGQDKEVLLGQSLIEAVHFIKSKDAKNVSIVDTIKAQLKYQ